MPRLSKSEVSAINIRINDESRRDYRALINQLYRSRIAVKVYGNSFVAISQFDENSGIGVFSKYDEIDIDGDWFDIEDFGIARPEKVDEVSIPETLRPNHSAFYFFLDEELHIVTYEIYSRSKSLSSRSVEIYFRHALYKTIITEQFGRVEADTIKSFGEVERIISLPQLKELKITIRRPNPDDIDGDLAAEIEERLREQKGEEFQEGLKSKDRDGLQPNERTKKLAIIGAENGEVSAKSIENGVQVPHTTREKPEKVVDTYDSEIESDRHVFARLSSELRRLVTSYRTNAATPLDAEESQNPV